jgi:hypothetical protein
VPGWQEKQNSVAAKKSVTQGYSLAILEVFLAFDLLLNRSRLLFVNVVV